MHPFRCAGGRGRRVASEVAVGAPAVLELAKAGKRPAVHEAYRDERGATLIPGFPTVGGRN